MSGIDWFIMCTTMVLVVGYGVWKTREQNNMESYFLGGNEAKWWTVGLSVMATQASAITFLSTPGQAYYDGMGFVQFYFALPLALIIICITFIPIFYKLKVYTAYEFLENRFDLKTRSVTAFLFLLQRGLATGITIYAPAIILSSVMGWNLNVTTIVIGCIAILYTVSGGTKAVHVTHKLQMIIILIGLFIIFFLLLGYLPDEYSFNDMLHIAGASDKLEIIDTKFDLKDRYNIWTSFIAAPFLFLSYFGTDQSQVQRYISGKSVKESRMGLMMNALLKVPLQFFILFIGVLVFLFFQFNRAPIFFNESVVEQVRFSDYAEEGEKIIDEYNLVHENKLEAHSLYAANPTIQNKQKVQGLLKQESKLRDEYRGIITQMDKSVETNDKDYVFINFILNQMPRGLVGLLLAMIFFAAMSSTASELNALASTTSVDFYKRIVVQEATDRHYVIASKLLTLFWGIVAILFASIGTLFENLIQFVNIVGSIFYGTILGVFLVAFYLKKIKANAVFFGAVLTQIMVFWVYLEYVEGQKIISFLWLNLIGVVGVISFSSILQIFMPGDKGLISLSRNE